MTTFQKHDRVRVLDRPDRPAELPAGMILTVEETPSPGSGLVTIDGVTWGAGRFELVEHAVGQDRNGEPLYAGDIVIWRDREAMVDSRTEKFWGKGSLGVSDNGGWTGTRSERVVLVRHHWEAPDLAEAVGAFGKTLAEYQKAERDRVAVAVEGLTKALQKALDAARPVEAKISVYPEPPTKPGSIVLFKPGGLRGEDVDEAVLIGYRGWVTTDDGSPVKEHDVRTNIVRVIRDAGKES